jgi:hypothetical protein
MRAPLYLLVVLIALIAPVTLHGQDQPPGFHDDYYLGFSQGVYYGLMLGGIEYEVAWCMKSELAHVGQNIGSGGEFQAAMDEILDRCKAEFDRREQR